jgi:hypothetical protein
MYERVLKHERTKKEEEKCKDEKRIMASKAITDMVLKKRELNFCRPHCRRTGSQLSYWGWHKGMCFSTAKNS